MSNSSPEYRQGAPPFADAVTCAITDDQEQFFGPEAVARNRYIVDRVFSNHLFYELNGGIIDMEPEMITADLAVMRYDSGHRTRQQLHFMRIGHDVVPLGTHARHDPSGALAYQLDGSLREIVSTRLLSDYILDKLPGDVLLTRVLSADEAAKFAAGDPGLGSSMPPFWYEAVHTAIHNVTNEFEHSNAYPQMVGMLLPRSRLQDLVASGSATLGTYGYMFRDRDPDSPLPFEAEAVFKHEAIADLLRAYRTWSEQTGADYLDNPFHQTGR